LIQEYEVLQKELNKWKREILNDIDSLYLEKLDKIDLFFRPFESNLMSVTRKFDCLLDCSYRSRYPFIKVLNEDLSILQRKIKEFHKCIATFTLTSLYTSQQKAMENDVKQDHVEQNNLNDDLDEAYIL
ncbi:unnamed protein product, partial [Didymodactylos carnosus]